MKTCALTGTPEPSNLKNRLQHLLGSMTLTDIGLALPQLAFVISKRLKDTWKATIHLQNKNIQFLTHRKHNQCSLQWPLVIFSEIILLKTILNSQSETILFYLHLNESV